MCTSMSVPVLWYSTFTSLQITFPLMVAEQNSVKSMHPCHQGKKGDSQSSDFDFEFCVEEFQRKHWLLTSSKYVRLCLGYGTQHITKVDKNILKVTVKVYRCQLLTRFINCNYKVLLHFWSIIFIGWILDTRQFTTRAPWTTWEGWTVGNILDCSLNK